MTRIGVVGCGYWGSKHVRVFHELPDAQLAIVCDRDHGCLEKVRYSYPGVRTTREFSEVLESDVDGIVIATPVNTHYPLARQALLAGKHVLVEKPMTTSVETAQELVQIAEEKRLVLMTGHTYQYHPAIEYLRDFLASGELGDLYYVDSARLNLGIFQPDVDVLWDLAPHDVSILLFLLGQNPIWVSAEATAHINPSLYEVSYLGLGFPGQVLAHIHVSWLDPCKVRRLTLVGSKRMVVFDDVSPVEQVRIYDKGVSLHYNGDGRAAPAVAYRNGEVRVPAIPSKEPLKMECADFIECIETGRRPRSSGVEGLKVISILQAAHRSLARGGGREDMDMIKLFGGDQDTSGVPSIASNRR